MEKQACHVEWGQLKIIGRPVMTGTAVGSSQLMRIASRTSPCLVHLFEDSDLVTIWRFPADPIFLLFGPPFHQINVEDIGEEGKSSDSSLLVITSDGRVWLLHCWREYDPSGRLTRTKREGIPEELQKVVQEILVDEIGIKPLYKGKSEQPEQWDKFEDVDTLEGQMPGSFVRDGGPIRRAERNLNTFEGCDASPPPQKMSPNRTSAFSGPMDMNSKLEKVSSGAFPRFDNKLKVKLVPAESLLCCIPGTLVAAFGPNDSVALLGVSGAMKVIPVRSSEVLPRSASTKADTVNDGLTDNRDSGCLLYACVSTQCNADEQPEGYVALLEAKFFQNLFGSADNMTSASGILHGDTKGCLYTSLISPELALCNTRLLFDFGQPVVAALAVPATTICGKDKLRFEGDSTTMSHHGSSLLIIGLLGKVILITGIKETVVQTDDGLFWPTTRNFSWRCKNNTLTARQLNERNLEFCEWEVFSPVTFACMLGPHRLCYCTRSEIFFTDLFDNEDVAQIYSHYSKTKHSKSAEPEDSVTRSLLKLSQKLQSSVPQDFKGNRMYKKELLSQKVPLVDLVVTVAGRGVSGGIGSSRPLVALTRRGRLLGVEVSNHVSNPALSIAGSIPKTWRPLLSRMEEKIQGLLQVVGEVAQSTDVIKRHGAAITLALKELATALPMAKEICLYDTRTRRPDTSIFGKPPPGKLSSFLTVRDHTSVVLSPENLSFSMGTTKFVPLTSFHSRKVKISIRVCNQSGRILSPYWSLLLELRSVSLDQSVHFSVPINEGLGLPVGAEYTHEFLAQLPGKVLDPVFVYLFICHHHNPHHLIAKSEPSLVSSGKASPDGKKNVLRSRLIDSSSSKVGTILNSPGADKTKFFDSSQAPGGVRILLSQYRIDLLSLLQLAPPHLGIDTRVHLRSAEKHANLRATSALDGNFLGRFSSKIILNCVVNIPYTVPKDTVKWWEELYLDDLLQRGSVSKDGKKLCVSAYDSETFSISLKMETAGENCGVIEVMLESSSLLLGSYLREALMWRLDQCKQRFIRKECCPWQVTKNLISKLAPKGDCYDETMVNRAAKRSRESSTDAVAQSKPATKVIDIVCELDERLAVVFELWENVLRFPERVQLSAVLDETCTLFHDMILAYWTCRAEEA